MGALIQVFGGPTRGAPEHRRRGPRVDYGTSLIFLEYGKEESLWEDLSDIWKESETGVIEKLGNSIAAIGKRILDWFTGKGSEGIWAIHQGKKQFYSYEELKLRKAKAANWYPVKE